jgi:hypothetical protein
MCEAREPALRVLGRQVPIEYGTNRRKEGSGSERERAPERIDVPVD